jgi:hypothetical protein
MNIRTLEAGVAAPADHFIIGIGNGPLLIVEIDLRKGRSEEVFHLGVEPLLTRMHPALGRNEGGKSPAPTIVLPPAIQGGRVASDGLGSGLNLRARTVWIIE